MDKVIGKLLEAVGTISSLLGLAAFAIVALVIVLWLYRGRRPPASLWLVAIGAVVALVVIPAVYQSRGVYRLRVTVVDAKQIPQGDAEVWSSIGGEPKKVAGGWQFDIPTGSVPADRKVIVYAAIKSAFLRGQQSVELAHDYTPATIIQLSSDATARVRGIIVDTNGRGVPGVRVFVAGQSADAVVTIEGGGFDIPAHVAEGQQVYLHAEKEGFVGTDLWHPAGGTPLRIELLAVKK